MSGHLAPALVLDRYSAHKTLMSLAELTEDNVEADALWRRIHLMWTVRGMMNQLTLSLSPRELQLLRELGVTAKPKVVEYKYVAIYRHPDAEEGVRLKSATRPPRRKSFRIPGYGSRKFTRVKLYKIRSTEKESSSKMPTKTRKRNTKAAEAEAEDLDELEGLEELEDLEGEEPEDDEEVEEAPKRKKRAAKPAAEKPARKRRAKKVVEEEPDEEEDEEDEEEEPAPKRTRKRSASNAAKAGKGKSKGGPAAGRTTKEITGGVGSAELAEAASEAADAEITGRDVRVWLRKNEIDKDEESGRYTWPSESNKVFKSLAKRIAKDLGE